MKDRDKLINLKHTEYLKLARSEEMNKLNDKWMKSIQYQYNVKVVYTDSI